MRSTKTLLSLVPPVEARQRAVVAAPKPLHPGLPWYVFLAIGAFGMVFWGGVLCLVGLAGLALWLGLRWLVGVV